MSICSIRSDETVEIRNPQKRDSKAFIDYPDAGEHTYDVYVEIRNPRKEISSSVT